MLTLTVARSAEEAHVYVSRWARGSRYPERLIDIHIATGQTERGRDVLRAAINAVLLELDRGDAPQDAL